MVSSAEISSLRERIGVLAKAVDLDGKRSCADSLKAKSLEPDFWNSPEEARKTLKDLAELISWIEGIDGVSSAVDDIEVLVEFQDEAEALKQYEAAQTAVGELEFRNMLSEEGDNLGAVLTINSGAGGTESNDWSEMLLRMYTRYCERQGFKVTVTDLLEGEEAGIKSATIQI